MSAAHGTDSFDISGTSVSGLQNFLSAVPDTSVRDALEQLRPSCTGLSATVLSDMIEANTWEVGHLHVRDTLSHVPMVQRAVLLQGASPIFFRLGVSLTRNSLHCRSAAPNCCCTTPRSRRFYCAQRMPSCSSRSSSTMAQRTGVPPFPSAGSLCEFSLLAPLLQGNASVSQRGAQTPIRHISRKLSRRQSPHPRCLHERVSSRFCRRRVRRPRHVYLHSRARCHHPLPEPSAH